MPTEPLHACPTRALSDIRLVVVHWDGGAPIPEGYDPIRYYASEAHYHIMKDWDGRGSYGFGLMYNEKVSRDGRAWITRPAEHVVWAASGANEVAYNICVDATVGSHVTAAQIVTLRRRIDAARRRFGIGADAVRGHGELTGYGNATTCPGEALMAFLADYRRGE